MARFGKCVQLAAVGLVLSCLAGSGAQKDKSNRDKPSGDLDPVGIPKNLEKGDVNRVAIWFARGKWHLKTVSKDNSGGPRGDKDVFTGSVTIEGGKLSGYDFKNLEKAKKAANADWIFLHANGKGFDFQFATSGKADTFNFEVSKDASDVRFNCEINDKTFPKRVLIGAKGQHPDKFPFKLPASPKD